MAMGPERSKPLHNFSLPCLKWGSQRFLRCVNVTPQNHQPEPSSLDRRSSRFQSKFQQSHINKIEPFPSPKRKPNNNNSNIDGVQEKLVVDLGVAPKKLKVSIFEDGGDEGGGGDAKARPWNLRTRRAACKAPPQSTPTPTPHEEKFKFFNVGSSSPVKEKKKINERTKFQVSLSKEEVEHDFLALVGTRPPRRPKKRPRIVQRQLDTLFPGLWLTEVTAESYKVPDVPE